MAKPCTKMPESTLRARLQAVEARLMAYLPGQPGKPSLKGWLTRYRRAIDVLRQQA